MPDQSPEWTAASRLVRRAGFGSTGKVVDEVVTTGPAAYLTKVLSPDAGATASAPDLHTPDLKGKPSDAEKKQIKQQQRKQRTELTGWWLRQMATTTLPTAEKLTFCWHNHFATSLAKVKVAALILRQNQALRAGRTGSFGDLALAMLTDAAMLRWLDGQKNTAASPNENLSREFIELFALGHGGGYTESDVREGAKALTGWTIADDGTTRRVAKRHDDGPKTVLGVTGDLDETGFCDAVLAQDASAGHVIGRLWSQLVSATPPTAQVIAELTTAYGDQRDLRAVVGRMLGGPELPAAEGTLVVSPVEWVIGAVRALGVPTDAPENLTRIAADLRSLGQLPFYPPSVGGWPAGQAWLSTAAVGIRLRTASWLAKQGDLSSVEQEVPAARAAAAAYLLGVAGWSDRSAAALADVSGDPVALVAVALTTAEYLVH